MEWQTQSIAFVAISVGHGCGFHICNFCPQITLIPRSCIGKPHELGQSVPKLYVLRPGLFHVEGAVGHKLCPC